MEKRDKHALFRWHHRRSPDENDIVDVISSMWNWQGKEVPISDCVLSIMRSTTFLFRDAVQCRCITVLAAEQEVTYTILLWNMRIILLERRFPTWLTGRVWNFRRSSIPGKQKEKAEQRAALLEINKLAAQYFYYQLRRESGKTAHGYLLGRGLSGGDDPQIWSRLFG